MDKKNSNSSLDNLGEDMINNIDKFFSKQLYFNKPTPNINLLSNENVSIPNKQDPPLPLIPEIKDDVDLNEDDINMLEDSLNQTQKEKKSKKESTDNSK